MILSEGAFRLQMRFEKGRIGDFYAHKSTGILEERKHWLRDLPDDLLVTMEEAAPILAEFAAHEEIAPLLGDAIHGTVREKARTIGERLEPDYLLLRVVGGEIRLVCACVCFPSSWNPKDKIGRPIEEIHGVVPGLNAALASQIHAFLERLRPGISWERTNWGLSRSPELNQHPKRQLAKLDESCALEEIFFRVEWQSLAALPKTGGILFGIRIESKPVGVLAPADRHRLATLLQTMPEEMAQYKNLARARRRIIELLRG